MRKSYWIVAGTAALILALAGCSGGNEGKQDAPLEGAAYMQDTSGIAECMLVEKSSATKEGWEKVTEGIPAGTFTVTINGETNSFKTGATKWDTNSTESVKWAQSANGDYLVADVGLSFKWEKYSCSFTSDDGATNMKDEGTKPSGEPSL